MKAMKYVWVSFVENQLPLIIQYLTYVETYAPINQWELVFGRIHKVSGSVTLNM